MMKYISNDGFFNEAFVYHMKRGNFQVLMALADKGALPESTDELGNNVLHHAIARRDIYISKTFFEKLPDLMFQPNKQGVTPCLLAVEAAMDDIKSEWLSLVVPDQELHSNLSLLAISPSLIPLYMEKAHKNNKKSTQSACLVLAGIRTTNAFFKAYRERLMGIER